MTIHFLSQLNLTQTLLSFSTNSIVELVHLQIFKKKRYGLLFSHLISLILLHFLEYLCLCFDFCYGSISMILGLFLFGLFKVLFPCKLISVDGFIFFSSICLLEII